MKLHPNITISKTQCTWGTQDFTTLFLARVSAGNPPDATVWWDTPVALGIRGAVEPLDALMATAQYSKVTNWPASALASCTFGGKTWGLPVTAGSLGIYYNADMLQQKGIPSSRSAFPKTMDDLRKLSKEFTYWKGNTLVTAGYIPFGDDNWPVTMYTWPALFGGQMYDAANMKYTIDADANVAAMEYAVSWLNEEYKGNWQAVKRSGNWTGYINSSNQPPAFQNNGVLTYVAGSWFLGDMYQVTPKYKQFNVAPFPVGAGGAKSISGFWPNWLIIPQGSKHVPEAFEWLDYLSGPGMVQWFSVTPDLPANKTVPANLLPAVTVKNQGKAFAQDVMTFFHHQLNVSIPLWNSPVQDFAQNELTKAVNAIMYKSSTPKQALASAQQACQNELQRVLKQAKT
jgi:ABC-type glycerol-3-phosphate transport system substrate-binding protein